MSEPESEDAVVLGCIACGRFSRVSRRLQSQMGCGGCKTPLADATWRRQALPSLASPLYEHPWDRKALEALQKAPAFSNVVSLFNKHGLDHVLKIQCTGSNLRVNSRNIPEAYTALREVCRVLNLAEVPDLYIEYDDQINAYAAGVHAPLICLTSGCLEALTRDELYFILGHEVGHLKSNHLLCTQIAAMMPYIGDLIGEVSLNVGKLFSRGLEAALYYWYRMSELTADRAGLLACQDVNVATHAFIKLAGLPRHYYSRVDTLAEDFRQQASDFDGYDEEWLTKLAKMVAGNGMDHPWTVARASELQRWIESGEFAQVMKAGSAPALPPGQSVDNPEDGGEAAAKPDGGTDLFREAAQVSKDTARNWLKGAKKAWNDL